MEIFEPDYHHILAAATNKRPMRLPLYEHNISPIIMGRIMGEDFSELINGDTSDKLHFFQQYCRFFKQMTYDTVSFEFTITQVLPGGGALRGGKPGPIQNRKDFESYPWDQLAAMYWQKAAPRFDAIIQCIPDGMKLIGGIGNGVFEVSEDLVGLEYLAYMQVDDPDLFANIYVKIGDLMVTLWRDFLGRYGDFYTVCRFGDDLGFKSGTLTSKSVVISHIIPQYKRVIDLIKSQDKPFLWHSCGSIFEVMDAVIAAGIDAKHSNEDSIAPFDQWIDLYNDRIGLFGGIDVDLLCRESPDTVMEKVITDGRRFRRAARGFAIGSGNSIPDYVPVDGYLAMIEAVKKIRRNES